MDLSALVARAEAAGILFETEGGELYLSVDRPEALPSDLLDEVRQYKAQLLEHLASPARIYLDFETASRLDLQAAGAAAYAEHPSTRVLLLSYAIGDGPARTWRPGNPIPLDLRQAIAAGATVVAHSGFNSAIWQHHQVPQGWPSIPRHRWSDTSARARVARLPPSLEHLAEALQLDLQKDKAGRALMLRLSRECFVGGREPTPEELGRLEPYAVRDVEVMRQVDGRIPELEPEAAAIAEMDAAMNARGMPVDVESTRKLIEVRDAEDARLTEEIATITEGAITTPNQAKRMLALLSKHGVRLPNVQKETLKQWLEDNPDRDDVAAKVIRIRREAASSAGKKLDAILQAATGTGVVRNTFLHHGAHTGRWAGRGAQLQNLPKNKLVDAEATLQRLTAKNDLHDGSPDARLSIKAQIAGVLRGLFKAPAGQVFVVADLSQIESRVLCWLAGQEDKLALYRAGKDIYLPTAQALGSDDRDLGKLVVLSCGFGATYRVLLKRAPLFGVTLTPAEAISYVAAWQRDNPQIVKFWADLHGAFRYVVEHPLGINRIAVGALLLWRDAEAAYVELPSGRPLIYRNPRLEPRGEFGTELAADLPEDGVLKPVRLWHGHLAENVTQAVACDVLTSGMLQLHREGFQITASIHDEVAVIARAEDAARVQQRMKEVMSSTPDWAPGLPLAAEGFFNRRFLKPPKGSARDPAETDQPAGNDTHAAVPDRAAERADAEVLKERVTELRLHADREIEALRRV